MLDIGKMRELTIGIIMSRVKPQNENENPTYSQQKGWIV